MAYSQIETSPSRCSTLRISSWFERNKIPICFWFLGLLNNSPFVIMLAAAKTISEGGTALVFLANVLPSMMIKLSAPYWFDKVSYRMRLMSASVLMMGSFGVVAVFSSRASSTKTVAYELFGVALSSAQGGLGEASLLALAGKSDADSHKGKCITCFSSGTGLAGVFGFLWKFVWNDWFGFSMSQTLWMATILAMLYGFVNLRCLSLIEQEEENAQRQNDEKETQRNCNKTAYQAAPQREEQAPFSPVEIEEDTDNWEDEGECPVQELEQVQKVEDMSTRDRVRLWFSLYPYMIPLFVVYSAEYALQAGTWTAIGFPVTSEEARDEFYEYSNWMYQVGVFLSRSSGTIYTAPLSVLWIMPVLQTINVVFFSWVATHHVFYNYFLLFPCLYVGLLGGGVYVNGYTRICADLPLEHREFALSSTSVAESFGIVMADILGLFIQSCIYRANGLEGAVVTCPIR